MMYNESEPADRDLRIVPTMGCLITFEGIDGSGKSTQINLLAARLRCEGLEVLELREPGGTIIGEAIRRILLDNLNSHMSIETELLLFEAARAQLTREVILPALQAGKWVICDRFFDSTLAYQGYGRGLKLDMIETLNDFAVGTCRPQATILLDLPVEAAVRRLMGRAEKTDRLDGESLAFMQKIREGYLQLTSLSHGRIVALDAELPELTLAQQIFQTIREGFGL
jgi:dTMP kinase